MSFAGFISIQLNYAGDKLSLVNEPKIINEKLFRGWLLPFPNSLVTKFSVLLDSAECSLTTPHLINGI